MLTSRLTKSQRKRKKKQERRRTMDQYESFQNCQTPWKGKEYTVTPRQVSLLAMVRTGKYKIFAWWRFNLYI
jgi:hypothetical protein